MTLSTLFKKSYQVKLSLFATNVLVLNICKLKTNISVLKFDRGLTAHKETSLAMEGQVGKS